MSADTMMSAYMKKHDPAFPLSIVDYAWPGMSMRDYFAAKAMSEFSGMYSELELDFSEAAQHAYAYADAMLKERAK